MGEPTKHCGRCGHPSFTHASDRCTAVDLAGASGDTAVEVPCDCARSYAQVIGEER
ncbi:hypothetical protein [Mycolicibacterium fortuitum]|uniref:hypothetical protein n=1 Tax=Mycolicibacterium fortuitum TaxID=1766 RepID=UPI0026218541|nr:hypothetical protein [Mycolicibacterium fortuitum]